MTLLQIHNTVFLDPDALAFVRFEDEEDPTATLKFKDGTSETLTGAAARELRRRLTDDSSPATTLPDVQAPPTGEAAAEAASAVERRTLRLGTVVVSPAVFYRGQKKTWFLRLEGEGRAYILAFVNAKGSCSVRTFDAETGVFLGKHYHAGDYQDAFAHLLEGAKKLTVSMQPNLERDCKERLPDDVLKQLRRQILGLTSEDEAEA